MNRFRSHSRRGLIALLYALTLLLIDRSALGASLQQSGAPTIRYGQQALGQITPASRVAFYFLRAERGDVISITMRRTSGTLDPHLDFATADGQILISNDDDPQTAGTLNAGIRDYTILKSGVYLIQATSFGSTQGSFLLAVTQTSPEEIGLSFESAQLIDYGMTLAVTLAEDSPQRFFRFSAGAGDVLTVTARSDDLAPTLAILDDSAAELARSSTGQARIAAFNVPQAGAYTLVTGAAPGENIPDAARVEVELAGRAAPIAGQPQPIAFGAVVSGLIASEHPTEEYVFTGSAGEVVRVRMERASGDLDPLVTLYASDRKQIAFDDDTAGDQDALIERFTLPYDGQYILSASRFERAQGQTTGAYILHLERIGTGE